MNVLIQGSSSFSDYSVFMRAMGVALSDKNETELNIYSVGPHKLNNKAIEFKNVTEKSLAKHGVKLQFRTIPVETAKTQKFNQMFYFCKPGERISSLAQQLSDGGLDVLVFRY